MRCIIATAAFHSVSSQPGHPVPRLFSEIETPLHPQVHGHRECYWTSMQTLNEVILFYYCDCGRLMYSWTE
jgi:hypothetical protein